MLWLSKPHRLQKKLLKLALDGPLGEYLRTPLPDPAAPIEAVDYLALDFETTGLDVRSDHIISAGYCDLRARRVQLASACHVIVNSSRTLSSESVGIHRLTDDVVHAGVPLAALMHTLLKRMAGKVVLAHFQRIEYSFLQQASRALYGQPLPLLMVDTMQIELRRMQRLNRPHSAASLRLFNLREAYGLPRYHAHNALEDAIGTAELFLAQTAPRDGAATGALRLRDILS